MTEVAEQLGMRLSYSQVSPHALALSRRRRPGQARPLSAFDMCVLEPSMPLGISKARQSKVATARSRLGNAQGPPCS
jgi:hypothetical protein